MKMRYAKNPKSALNHNSTSLATDNRHMRHVMLLILKMHQVLCNLPSWFEPLFAVISLMSPVIYNQQTIRRGMIVSCSPSIFLVVELPLVLICLVLASIDYKKSSGAASLSLLTSDLMRYASRRTTVLVCLMIMNAYVLTPRLLVHNLMMIFLPETSLLGPSSSIVYFTFLILVILTMLVSLAITWVFLGFVHLGLPGTGGLASTSKITALLLVAYPTVTILLNELLFSQALAIESKNIFLVVLAKLIFPVLIVFMVVRGAVFFNRKWKKRLGAVSVIALAADILLLQLSMETESKQSNICITLIISSLVLKGYYCLEELYHLQLHVPRTYQDAVLMAKLSLEYGRNCQSLADREVAQYLGLVLLLKKQYGELSESSPLSAVQLIFRRCTQGNNPSKSALLYYLYYLLQAGAGITSLSLIVSKIKSRHLSFYDELILESIKCSIILKTTSTANISKSSTQSTLDPHAFECGQSGDSMTELKQLKMMRCTAVFETFMIFDRLLQKMATYSNELRKFYQELKLKEVNIQNLHSVSADLLRLDSQVDQAFTSMQIISPKSTTFHIIPFAMFLHFSTNNNRRARMLIREFNSRKKYSWYGIGSRDTFASVSPSTVILASSAESSDLGHIKYISGNYGRLLHASTKSKELISSYSIYDLIGEGPAQSHRELVEDFLEKFDKPYIGTTQERAMRYLDRPIYWNAIMQTVFNIGISDGIELLSSIEVLNKPSYYLIVSQDKRVVGVSRTLADLSDQMVSQIIGKSLYEYSSDLCGYLDKDLSKNEPETPGSYLTVDNLNPLEIVSSHGGTSINYKSQVLKEDAHSDLEAVHSNPIRIKFPIGFGFKATASDIRLHKWKYGSAEEANTETQIYLHEGLFEQFSKLNPVYSPQRVSSVSKRLIAPKKPQALKSTSKIQKHAGKPQNSNKSSVFSIFLVGNFVKGLIGKLATKKQVKKQERIVQNIEFDLNEIKQDKKRVFEAINLEAEDELKNVNLEGSINSVTSVGLGKMMCTIEPPRVGFTIAGYLIGLAALIAIIWVAVFLCLYFTGAVVGASIHEWVKGRNVPAFNNIGRSYVFNSMASLIEERLMSQGYQSRNKYEFLGPNADKNPLEQYEYLRRLTMKSVAEYLLYTSQLSQEYTTEGEKIFLNMQVPLGVDSGVMRNVRVTGLNLVTLVYSLTETWRKNIEKVTFDGIFYDSTIGSIDVTGPKIMKELANFIVMVQGQVIAKLQSNTTTGIYLVLLGCELLAALMAVILYLYRRKMKSVYEIYRFAEENDLNNKLISLHHWDTCIEEMMQKEDFNAKKLIRHKKEKKKLMDSLSKMMARNKKYKLGRSNFFGLGWKFISLIVCLQGFLLFVILANSLMTEKRLNEIEIGGAFRQLSACKIILITFMQYHYDAILMRAGIGRKNPVASQFGKMQFQVTNFAGYLYPSQKFYYTEMDPSVRPYFLQHLKVLDEPCKSVNLALAGIDLKTCENLAAGSLKKGVYPMIGWLYNLYQDYLMQYKNGLSKTQALAILSDHQFLEMEFIMNRLVRPLLEVLTSTFQQGTEAYIIQFEKDFWQVSIYVTLWFFVAFTGLLTLLQRRMWTVAGVTLYSLKILPLGSIQKNARIKVEIKSIRASII